MIEESLKKNLFSQDKEKTFIDKLLGKEEIERTRDLIKKDPLTRSEIMELLHACSSAECKLWNFGAWERYVQLKYFVWIREFTKISEIMFDQKEKMFKDMNLSERSKTLLKNNERLIEHNTKFLVELYFNMARTTLSLGGTAFMEFLKQKFEVVYPAGQPGTQPQEQGKMKLWGLGGKKSA
jgi:hypothetical protein